MNIVVDAGGLLAAERGDPRLAAACAFASTAHWIVPVCVAAQVWRDQPHQARLERFLECCEIVGAEPGAGQRHGELLDRSGSSDVISAAVIDLARERGAAAIVTSVPDDLSRLAEAAGLSAELLPVAAMPFIGRG